MIYKFLSLLISESDPDERSGLCKMLDLTTCKTYSPGERGAMYVACLVVGGANFRR
jgi:hypothetical protein